MCCSMSCYVLYCHVLLFSFTHCRRHSVTSVFHCEDLFLRWSSYFTGFNCWSHPSFCGAKYSSHYISSFLTGVNCLSHPIYYGANCSSHHVVTCYVSISHPLLMVLTIRASVIFLPLGVISVWALQYYLFCCRFRTIIRSSS